MFDHRHYVPILKGLIGEYRALREMKGPRSSVTPMIDVPPIGWDFALGEPAKTADEHLKRLADKIGNCWGHHLPIFFDLCMIPDEVMEDGRHPLTYVFDTMRGNGGLFDPVKAIPVTGLGRAASYQAAVAQAVAKDQRGMCLRLEKRDFEDGDGLESEVATVLRAVQISPVDTDLVLDMKEISPPLAGPMTFAVRAMLKGLPMLRQWRTLTLAAGAFPQSLSEIQPEQMNVMPRTEWVIWKTLIGGKDPLPRCPAFGDYGIRYSHYADERDPRTLKPTAANVRYTTTKDWLVWKGRNPSEKRAGISFSDLCKALVERREFCGDDFSWGDSKISDCARGQAKNGNGTTWTQVATSHHLAFVRLQIANLSDS